MQVSLPDRPGSLGMLASAIGSAGADIRGLEVLKSEDGTGYDQITVAVPGTDPSDPSNSDSSVTLTMMFLGVLGFGIVWLLGCTIFYYACCNTDSGILFNLRKN